MFLYSNHAGRGLTICGSRIALLYIVGTNKNRSKRNSSRHRLVFCITNTYITKTSTQAAKTAAAGVPMTTSPTRPQKGVYHKALSFRPRSTKLFLLAAAPNSYDAFKGIPDVEKGVSDVLLLEYYFWMVKRHRHVWNEHTQPILEGDTFAQRYRMDSVLPYHVGAKESGVTTFRACRSNLTTKETMSILIEGITCLKKNLNACKPSEHPPS